MNKYIQHFITLFGLLIFWQLLVTCCALPDYILPDPQHVFLALFQYKHLLLQHGLTTLEETLLGFIFGALAGCIAGCCIAFNKTLARWMLPLIIITQAMPVFAIAPLLVIWFGYGLNSKIIAAMIMIFFPVTSALYDGLRRTPTEWMELATTMNSSKLSSFWHIQLPAALPSLASGLRMAAVAAPIGAIVGEWVGASKGLGYLMLNAHARLQIDMMFAALLLIIMLSLTLYWCVDISLKKLVWWNNS